VLNRQRCGTGPVGFRSSPICSTFFEIESFHKFGQVSNFQGKSPPQRKNESADVIWGKNMKRGREKGGKCKRKRKKG
jgi:hypothetical protein